MGNDLMMSNFSARQLQSHFEEFHLLNTYLFCQAGEGVELLPEIPEIVANTPSALFLFVALNYTF